MKNGAQIVVETLRRQGVEVIFGYPGGKTLLLHDALHDAHDIRHILVRHEQGAAHSADGYTRTTGKVGVCLATSGPGATNLVTGIATAFMDSIPLVALTCQVASTDLGTMVFQEADMTGITRPITKRNYLVTKASDLAAILDEAFHVARSGRPGPVLVDLPSDILAAKVEAPIYRETESPDIHDQTSELEKISKAAELINMAKRPLIYAGGGVTLSGGAEELRRFAAKGNMPVTHTLMAVGVMEAESPLSIGMLGMYGAWHANRAVHDCDCLIAIGARFDDRVTGCTSGFAPHAAIIHIDMDPESIRKSINITLPIATDARRAMALLEGMIEQQDRTEWIAEIRAWEKEAPLPRPEREELVPHEIMESISSLVGPNPVIAADVGLSQMWSAHFLGASSPRRFITSGGLGTMGYALPAALGAAVGNPGATVIAITGDGAFQMNVQELATCAYYGIPVKTILLNNGTLGMVRQFQEVFFKGRYAATDLGSHVDFCTVARGFGVPAFRADCRASFKTALKEALSLPGPAVVEVTVDPDCYAFPMVPPGQKSVEMIFNASEWQG